MTILYIANESDGARAAAAALGATAPDVRVVWAGDLDQAAAWIRELRDLAALVMEASVDGQSCTAFLKQVRSAGLTAPVVIIAPEELAPRLESLKSRTYDFVARNRSLVRNLPVVVSQAIERAQTRGTVNRTLVGSDGDRQDAERRQAEFDARLADAIASRSALERRLADLEASLRHREQTWAIERTTATERRTTLEALVHEERAKSAELESQLAHATAALQDAERRYRSATTSAAEQLAERQAQYERSSARAAATREMVEEQLREAAIEVDRARQRHSSAAAEVDRLAQREAELASQLAGLAAIRDALDLRLADAATAIADADERATCERLAATARQADVEARLAQELKKAETLERELADARSAARDAEQRFGEETAAVTARAHEQAARLEDQIARGTLAHESQLAEAQEQFRTLALDRDSLTKALGAIREESQRLNTEHRDERESLERARLTADAEVRRLAAEHTQAQHDLEEASRNFQQTLERVSIEHAGALAALAASLADRDAQIEEQAARHAASLEAEVSERTQLQDTFRTALADRTLEIEQLEGKLKATIQELDATRSRRDVLQTEAALVPQLQAQLDERGAESRRQFEHSPMALCRCTRGGALIRANHAFAALAGYRRPDQLRSADFAATLFESPDDLSWLIERCLSTKARESVETVWKGRKGNRLVVRLWAFASASDVIEIGAEDLTKVRALQDRLEQAHRMEAVGWLASEIAVTCGNLLRDVQQNVQQWLMTVGSNTALRRQGEMVLDDASRAASFLRQLAAYSDEEIRGLVPVDLNKVLRDLEPVLKRVAGDAVELELPKMSSPLDVDVKAERVERLLVNLASYGRERMPLGGRLSLDLDTVIVDRRFIEKYPNVRQGPHALITVKEARPAALVEEPRLRDEPASDTPATEKPGVDLGALQRLISECGGHLWMKVGPAGEMVVKIHLPLDTSDSQARPRTSLIRSRGSLIARWFRH